MINDMRKLILAVVASTLCSTFLPTSVRAAPEKSPGLRPVDSRCDEKTIRTEGWHLPHPPYPYAARAHHEQGSLDVEITTGANGRAIKVSVPKSTSHPNLNLSAAKWAYTEWSGPPNHRMRVPLTFLFR